jgi:phosphate-selective porin OprO/OprP
MGFLAAAADLWAQDGQAYTPSYFAADPTRTPELSNQPQMIAAGQAKPAENAPPDFSALPPVNNSYDADLAKRVADLEKQLANYAKAAEGAKTQAPSKPLIAPSGRIQADVAGFTQNAASDAQFGNAQNTVGFRRARLALLGEYEVIDYIIEMDFANRGINAVINSKDQSTAFKDVYIQVRELPLIGNVRVGHFKECFGLEQLTSDNYTTFMAFNWLENQRATWAIGAFTNQTGFDQPPTFVFDHWGLDLTMRATYLPWYDEPSGGRGLLHTGIDYAYRSAPDGIGTFASRPESAFAPSVVSFTLSDVNEWQMLGTEAALVYGPLSFQSEFFASTVERRNDVNNNFYGTYAFVSYFLTGENRPYNRKMGVFDRVRPYEDFFHVRTGDGGTATGHGAWELAYRFSYINLLDDLTVKGAGLATDHTFGLNWYLNPFTKVMFNYVHSIDTFNAKAGNRVTGGNLDVFEMRCAMDF